MPRTSYGQATGGSTNYSPPLLTDALTLQPTNGTPQRLSTVGDLLLLAAQVALAATPVHSAIGAQNVPLPASASMPAGYVQLVFDADYHAGVNNITVAAAAGELIFDQNVAAATYKINTSGGRALFINEADGWHVVLAG